MTNEPLFEATVLPSHALSWEGRLYLAGEVALVPLGEGNALEHAGVVTVAATAADAKPTRMRPAA
jgi:hypothetical protein